MTVRIPKIVALILLGVVLGKWPRLHARCSFTMRTPARYSRLLQDYSADEIDLEFPNSPPRRHWLRTMAHSRVTRIVVVLLILTILFRMASNRHKPPAVPPIELPDRILHSWAQYSPYFPLARYEVPSGCVVTQVTGRLF